MRRSIWTPQGRAALALLRPGQALLAFDFDGTLAPLVEHPDHAQVPARWLAWLRVLARRWPVAVLSGRGLADLQARLGFDPRFVVGNHGAETHDYTDHRGLAATLDPARRLLRQQAATLATLGVTVEDKGLSIALHYRRAANPHAARRALQRLLPHDAAVRVEPGHQLLNLRPAAAPDKGDALLAAMAACGLTRALVVGDDRNDEAAFAKAPAGSVTVRVGPRGALPSAARFSLPTQAGVGRLLRHLALQPRHGERIKSGTVFCAGAAMEKTSMPVSSGLQEPLEKTEAVTAEIERAANHALVIGTVLAHEIPAELQVGEVAQAIEQTEDLEQQLAESAEKLADVSASLEQEIAKRRAVTRELTQTREQVEQLVDQAANKTG